MHPISETFKGRAKIRKYQKIKHKFKFRDNELLLTIWVILQAGANALSEKVNMDSIMVLCVWSDMVQTASCITFLVMLEFVQTVTLI